jgi:peptidoglycan/LPS O-acetylase OafA/YrhL
MQSEQGGLVSPAVEIPGWSRLDGIDLLRGIAILLVLMNHVNMRLLGAHTLYTRSLPRRLVTLLVWNGQPGVQIFFAISGFLITAMTLRRWGTLERVEARAFYLLRFARIAPLLLLLLAVLSILHLAGVPHFVLPSSTGGLGRALVAALTLHINLLEARRGYLAGSWDILWSLSIEEMFYLFFPLLCWLLGRGRLLVVVLSIFVVLGPFGRTLLTHGNPVWAEYSYLGGMDAIAMGCLTAIVLGRRAVSRWLLWLLGSTGAGLLVFTLGFSAQAFQWGLGRSGLYMTIVAAGTCMLIAVSAQTQWRSPYLVRSLRLLGARSYEVYLTHEFVVIGLSSAFIAVGAPLGAVPVLFVASIVVAGLLGELVGRYYSEPTNRWLRARGEEHQQLETPMIEMKLR